LNCTAYAELAVFTASTYKECQEAAFLDRQYSCLLIKIFARRTLSAQQAARYYGRACTAPKGPAAKIGRLQAKQYQKYITNYSRSKAAGY
jgi:hypothetical protein